MKTYKIDVLTSVNITLCLFILYILYLKQMHLTSSALIYSCVIWSPHWVVPFYFHYSPCVLWCKINCNWVNWVNLEYFKTTQCIKASATVTLMWIVQHCTKRYYLYPSHSGITIWALVNMNHGLLCVASDLLLYLTRLQDTLPFLRQQKNNKSSVL